MPSLNFRIAKVRSLRGRLLTAAAALVVAGSGLGIAISRAQTPQSYAPAPMMVAANMPATAAPPRMLENGAPFSFADLVERVSPAVVTVTVEEQLTQTSNIDPSELPEPFRDFFNQFGQGHQFQQPRKAVSMGSGFIIDKSGDIVTNNHVVENGKKITVKLPDGREFDAKLVGADKATDIAVLKIKNDKPLPSVEFGDDRQVRVGDWVIAVGNPFGLSNTVTAGIISSIGRDIGNGPYTDFLQIDASINRGNSGGPTFDLEGKVIGMNTMIFSPSGGSVGIGFAIPSSTVREIVDQLKVHGHVSRGWLGVTIQSVTPDIAASVGSKTTKGAIVSAVVPGGPAAKAGFRQGDIVLALNGKSIEDNRDLTRRVALLAAGSTATFSVVHEGTQRNINVTIGSRKEDEQVASNGPPAAASSAEETGEAMGLGLAAVTPEVRREYNLVGNISGVLVTRVDPNSDAADKGIEPGDVVVMIANQSVRTPKEVKLRVAAAQAQGHKSVLVLVSGTGGQRFVALKIA
ncbi:MAG TPA: DegQ family serine endoprotease [Rhizomicrobium sp.]|nr:DegQ family serine endoprotease [Rhizomicrobium sp.]